ncbi:MAG: hypothetical protein HY722_12455 [Planctomycetes bacterium]|nr:hypothetical protein [Planctomycetota bacterium]
MDEADLDSLVRSYLAARGPDAAPLLRQLDEVYWDRTRVRLLRRLAAPDADPTFAPEERLLVDAGLLDPRLVARGTSLLRARLLAEIYSEPSGDALYPTEWFTARLAEHGLARELAGRREHIALTEGAAGEAERGHERLGRLRRRILAALEPAIRRLPGLREEVAASVVAGRLDERLDAMAAELSSSDRRAVETFRKLEAFRDRILASLQARSEDERTRSLAGGLERLAPRVRSAALSRVLADRRYRRAREDLEITHQVRTRTVQERREALEADLDEMRRLLALGVVEVASTPCAALLDDGPRTERAHVGEARSLAEDHDRRPPRLGRVLIAPYRGEGFYDWERDTLVLPRTPVRPPEEGVLRSLARARLLVDLMQDHGILRDALRGLVPEGDLATPFADLYHGWLARVARGEREALSREAYDVFRRHVGPDPAEVPVPSGLEALGSLERGRAAEQARAAARTGRGTVAAEALRRLAYLSWIEGDPAAASGALERALALQPVDGRALYAWAVMRRAAGEGEAARHAFGECATLAGGTLWQLYAEDALAAAGGETDG